MKRIYSAGGIVIRDELDGRRVLVSQHSGHHGWDFPKGHLEVGESSEAAAVREVKEETGIEAEVIERVGETKYFYFEDKQRVLKTVVFFLMKYRSRGEASTAFETQDMVWLPVGEVGSKLTFKDTKELWYKAKEQIEALS